MHIPICVNCIVAGNIWGSCQFLIRKLSRRKLSASFYQVRDIVLYVGLFICRNCHFHLRKFSFFYAKMSVLWDEFWSFILDFCEIRVLMCWVYQVHLWKKVFIFNRKLSFCVEKLSVSYAEAEGVGFYFREKVSSNDKILNC